MKLSRAATAAHLATTAGIALLGACDGLHASGFAIPETSVAGLGTANALVANPRETGAIAYNPAAIGFHDHASLSAAALFLSPSLDVSTLTGHHSSNTDNTIVTPAFQGVWKFDDRWGLGLGVTAPFGLQTVWSPGTFPTLSVPLGPLPPGVLHPTESKLEMLDVVPTVALRVNDAFSLAAGVDYYNARRLAFDTQLIRIRGDGDGWGWNLSAMYRTGPLSVGASYHSRATARLSGLFTQPGAPSVDAEADLDLPSRLQLGVRYAFSDRLALEFDWARTGWSNFNELVVKASGSGAVLTRSANHWSDAEAFRVGLTYDLTTATQLRLGYSYDQTGQPGEFFSARIPDADRQLFSIGLAQSLSGGWQVEGGYMYVKFADNNYRAGRPFNPLANPDVNGTTALNGDYSAHVHIFGVGVNKTF
jgi:long-chain fatty acid transport protein